MMFCDHHVYTALNPIIGSGPVVPSRRLRLDCRHFSFVVPSALQKSQKVWFGCTTAMRSTDMNSTAVANHYYYDSPKFNICKLLEMPPSSNPIAVGGHRGMGQNAWVSLSSFDCKANCWRENTIKSFLSCIQAGATFIEFDVQVTSDGVPVIWHDNYMVFGNSTSNPSSLPISQLSLAEFKSLAPIRSSSFSSFFSSSSAPSLGDDDEDMDMILAGASPQSTISSISSTTTTSIHSSSSSYGSLMRQGRNDLPALPGDPSLRQWQAQQEDDLPTLKEVFEAMPAAVAFDIEIKMTTPPHVAQTSAEEVDRVVTAILAAVDAAEADWPSGNSSNNNSNNNGGGRVIVYSSFDPEVCLEVRKRCPEACIMFLSDCGEHPYVDDRRNSAGAAIEFACTAGLQGVILESTVVKSDPVVVRVAGEKGLRVMTYGMLNDDEEWVGVQGRLGVCGVIVDDVERVVKAMR